MQPLVNFLFARDPLFDRRIVREPNGSYVELPDGVEPRSHWICGPCENGEHVGCLEIREHTWQGLEGLCHCTEKGCRAYEKVRSIGPKNSKSPVCDCGHRRDEHGALDKRCMICNCQEFDEDPFPSPPEEP